MKTGIIDLKSAGTHTILSTGKKAANLGTLLNNNFPIPPGFIIPTETCRDFFTQINLHNDIQKLPTHFDDSSNQCTPNALTDLCKPIITKIKYSPLPRSLTKTIDNAYDQLAQCHQTPTYCAIRSSASNEDLDVASFAGQHATYYYVKKKDLPKMIKNCWASLWTIEAVTYRITLGLDHTSAAMAVIVQEMINAEISGVTFTSDPLTGSPDRLITEAGWGLGAAIVDGRVSPDHYVLARKDLALIEKRISEKRFMIPPVPWKKLTTRLQRVPSEKQCQETLSTAITREITRYALEAEKIFGNPQDMEWSIADNTVHILQSRPITVRGSTGFIPNKAASKGANKEANKGTFYENELSHTINGKYMIFKPLLENFTEPMTPLSADLFAMEAPLGVRLIKGWCYTDIKGYRFFLPFKMSDRQISDWLYNIDLNIPPLKLSLPRVPIFLCSVAFMYFTMGVFFARTRGLPDDFMDRFKKLCKRIESDSTFTIAKTMSRLWSWYWKHYFDPIAHMPIFVNITSLRYITATFLLKKCLQKWTPGIPNDAAILLYSGATGILSAEMSREIIRLSEKVRNNESVKDLFLNHNATQLLQILQKDPEATEFLQLFHQFIEKYGHRGLKEIELGSPRWEESPEIVLGMIKNYLPDTVRTGQKSSSDRESVRNTLITEIHQKIAALPLEGLTGLRRKFINFMVKHCRYYLKLRENSRFYHAMGLHYVRKKILEVEKRLLAEGKLKCKDDIFYLHLHEIDALGTGDLKWFDVEDRIRHRRLEHIRLSKIIPPKTIGVENDNKKESPASEDHTFSDPRILHGHPVSGGRHEGIARVILDPSADIRLEHGEILVAPYTDPAWTPLFLTAGAAVVEVGSFLSHAGTLAREFGMPCVVDTTRCTRIIKTGMTLRVDGDTGIVTMISEPDEHQDDWNLEVGAP